MCCYKSCFVLRCSYLETVWAFWACFDDSLGRSRAALSVCQLFPTTESKPSLVTYPAPSELWVFPFWPWELVLFPTLCECWALFLFILLDGSFPVLGSSLKYIIITQLNCLRGPSANLFVCSLFFSGPLSYELQLPSSPWSLGSVSSTQGVHWAVPQFPFPAPWLRNSLKTVS